MDSEINIHTNVNKLSVLLTDLSPGNVLAHNKTVALGMGATIVLDYLTPADCIVDPTSCTEGITVSMWTRTNLFLEDGDNPIYILS